MNALKNIFIVFSFFLFGTVSSQTRTVTTSGGTTNYVPMWSGSSVQSSSVIYQKNTKIGIGTINPSSKFEVAEFIKFDSTLRNTAIGYQTLNSSPSGGGNTAIGYLSQNSMAGGASNIAVGGYTMQSMTSGYENTAMGMEAMRYANANRNAAFGISCLPMVTGDYNVAIGYGACRNTTSGVANVAIGDEAMSSYANGYLNTGRWNVAIGGETCIDNETGWYNIGIGAFACNKNRTGYGNVAVGSEALRYQKYGYNTALGFNAGKLDTNGTNNLFLGAYAGNYQASVSGKIYIGTRDYSNSTLENSRTPIIISSHATDSSQTSIRLNGILMLPIGAGASKVLTSDASGNATWASVSAGLSGATGDLISFSATNTSSNITSVSAGSYLRSGGVGTAPVWSTTKLLNAGTANYIPYWSSTNTQGESANLQFNGTSLGIGMAPVNVLDITQTQNATSAMSLVNASTGTAAKASLIVGQDATKNLAFQYVGSGFTLSAGLESVSTANTAVFLANNDAVGMHMVVRKSTGYFNIYTGGLASSNERMRVDASGNVGIGTTTISARLHLISTTEQLRVGYDASNYFNTTVSSTGGVTLNAVGSGSAFTFSDKIINSLPINMKSYTVATLPAGVQGDFAYVTDATAPTYLGALTGGGSVVCPVFYNGSAWVSH